jgi:hypothetical protein
MDAKYERRGLKPAQLSNLYAALKAPLFHGTACIGTVCAGVLPHVADH